MEHLRDYPLQNQPLKIDQRTEAVGLTQVEDASVRNLMVYDVQGITLGHWRQTADRFGLKILKEDDALFVALDEKWKTERYRIRIDCQYGAFYYMQLWKLYYNGELVHETYYGANTWNSAFRETFISKYLEGDDLI